MDDTFLMGTTSSITMQSTMRAGCRCENVVFVCLFCFCLSRQI